MKIGYARVSTTDQNLSVQIDGLEKEKCEKIYKEKLSGVRKDRPELQKALEELRKGDTLVVWKLDRLGRTVKQLLDLIEDLKGKGIHFKSIKDKIDTTTPTGTFFFHERVMKNDKTVKEIADALDMGRVTIYRYIQQQTTSNGPT